MQGIDATFDGVSLDCESEPPDVLLRVPDALPQIVVGGVLALAGVGCLAAYVALNRPPAAPKAAASRPSVEVASNPFGEIIIEPEWRPKTASLPRDPAAEPGPEAIAPAPPAPIARLESAPPPGVGPAPPAPPGPNVQPENVPLPPQRDVARIEDSAPLPPPRPPELSEAPARPGAPDRRLAQPGERLAPAPAPGDNRNVFQRLWGMVEPSGPAAAPPPASASAPAASPRVIASARPTAAEEPSAAQQGRGGRGLFGFFFSSPANLGRFGYDRYTAVYDISARTVYLPDGSRLEAHSGLGPELDDPRYVSERMRGPTPPHLYELTLREASFHGVQALRLNPVGDGDLYGRSGLLAHSFMLGPNGDSNGCVSFRDYEAFLRAYQNGEIKRLAVVTRL